MAKQANLWKWAAVALILGSSTALGAQCGCECAQRNWKISAEAIWWAPVQTDLSYAENGFVDPNVGFQSAAVIEDLHNDFFKTKYDWGFRLGYQYQGCAWALRTRYLWLETERLASSVRGDGPNDALSGPLFPGLGQQVTAFDRIDGTLDSIYNNVDLTLWRQVAEYNCSSFHMGVKFDAYFARDRTKVTGVGAQFIEDDLLQISGKFRLETENVGAVIGPFARGSLDLTCGLSIVIEAVIPAGVTYRHGGIDLASAVVTPPVPDPSFYSDLRIPVRLQSRACFEQGVQGSVVLAYHKQCGCVALSGQFGYEAQSYSFNTYGGPLLGFGLAY